MRLVHEEVEYEIKESILPEEIETDPSWIRRWFGTNRVVATLSRLLGTYRGGPTLVQTTPGGALSVSGAVSPYGGVRLWSYSISQTTSLPAGETESVWIVPSEGYVVKMIGVYAVMNPPTGATSGTHEWGLCSLALYSIGLRGSGAYNSQLVVRNYQAYSGFSSFVPATNWMTLAFPLLGTKDNPLQSYYSNKTNVSNGNERQYVIAVAEYPAIIP